MFELGEDNKTSHSRETGLSFPEIVGQEDLKRALLAVVANPDLDGLLVRGEKGTAKSTAVRALADLLPEQRVVADCPYGCPPGRRESQCDRCRERSDPPTARRRVPLVTLPLGATRERVVGSLSVADALDGDYEFDPGVLARANRGILYVDEVNLLDDHLVDVVLDAAASGVNRVERDGVSVSHPASFTIVGTMNPEEGDLRPQLRDRFALQTTVEACEEVDQRVEIIDRALGRTDDATDGGETIDAVRERLSRARDRLPGVELPEQFAREIAELCRDAGVDGHRGDVAVARAARTLAALDDRPTVIEPDVRRGAALALPHRLRSRPFEDAPDPGDLLDDQFDDQDDAGDGQVEDGPTDEEPTGETEAPDDGPEPEPEPGDGGRDDADIDPQGEPQQEGSESDGASADVGDTDGTDTDGAGADVGDTDGATEGTPLVPGQSRVEVGTAQAPDVSAPEAVESGRTGGGGRSQTAPDTGADGPRIRSRHAESTRDVDAAASVRAATARGASSVESRDLRQSVRRSDAAALVVFVVDASASMLPAMQAAKGTVLELLKDAYRQRDEVAFVAFAGDGADVLLPPTDSVTLAARHLKELPTGDRTPLPAGLRAAGDVLDGADPAAGVVVLVTDGRANVADGSPVAETRNAATNLAALDPHVVVVDAGEDRSRGLNGLIAEETAGERVPLAALSAERVDAAVGLARQNQL
ncbi:MAG: VWA domain-containing protein [Salinirussus sp.]